MLKLKNSGYSVKYRTEILDSAWKAFEQMLKEDKEVQNLCSETKNGTRKKGAKSKKSKKSIGIRAVGKKKLSTKQYYLFLSQKVEN